MSQQYPQWVEPYLSKEESEKISEIVKDIELHTSGEVVPVIIKSSSTVGHVPLILLPFTLLVGFFILSEWHFNLESEWLMLINISTSIILTKILSPLSFIERLLTPKGDQQHQVELRAEKEFYDSQLSATQGQTGILIFISLMERQVVVLGDQAISQKLPSETWQSVVDIIVTGIKKKNLFLGLEGGLQACGKILREHFPIQDNDTNELQNHLVIKEK
ncbi:MAG: TPM domain-containing protein [Bdellovibrionales bacterium]|nr:TPM domain-containing protein [Bdellovibrionales bacterium]